MLQKILVVIMGLVMSVVGALSPDGLLAGTNDGGSATLSADTAEETLATLRTSDGQAFARVSVLWVEVDGRRVTEDAWGTGEVEEIRFKVGVKDVDDVAMAVGEKVVELHPTDVITVRMFRGDFSYRGIGTPTATVQLQGAVKTTVLKQGDVTNRVVTQVGELDLGRSGAQRVDEKVAYVVLTTGERVDTVAVEDGGSRLFTEEAATAAEAKGEAGNLLAKWVKLDGKLVREYTWGDGAIRKIEFEPAESASRSVVLTYNGEETEVAAGERVVIEDFVGEYLVYQVSGGMMRVRLDGYAALYETAASMSLVQQGGDGAPLPSFDFAPISPRTTDTVQFRDRSTDDGIIVFRSWDFGDNTTGVLQEATHRFLKPGTYEVTLTVTDNDLRQSDMTRTIIVRNADPVPDFDFSPRVVTTDTLVSFSDRSYDSDGSLVNWTWDFGDGDVSYQRHPTHRFTRGGNATVTLTVTDDLGDRASLSKVVIVRNTPPTAGFTYAGNLSTMDPIQFLDNSTDTDGDVIAWNWSFGDGRYGSGSAPVHAYARPGLYTVTLTATDDGGDSDTASTTVFVNNRAPFANFSWLPEGQPASVPITFTSHSVDPDGAIVSYRWNFGDGTEEATSAIASHTFASAGQYLVTLTVMDNTLASSSVQRSVDVANSAPRANFLFGPSPALRGLPVTFTDSSTDPDGDALAGWSWDFGDGSPPVAGRTATHTFESVGSFPVTLTVEDDEGRTSLVTRTVRVLNRAPVVSFVATPERPTAGETMTFTASGYDPDMPEGALTYEWRFSDGTVMEGESISRNFTRRGDYTVQMRGTDAEGGVSAPVVRGITVENAKPTVVFGWTPLVPRPDQVVTFTEDSFSMNGAIRDWSWDFGDGSPLSPRPEPTHAYARNGTYVVSLKVTDVMDQSTTLTRTLVVNDPPVASFVEPPALVELQTAIPFTDTSTDLDGTIVNWTWTFGDGYTSYDRHATHPGFSQPGSYAARLTVTDDMNATDSHEVMLNVLNSPPVAQWEYDTLGQPLERGRSILFRGYDLSYDPDGTPLQSFRWDFDDATPAVSAANTTHTFARSGLYGVGLVVNDGEHDSARTLQSHKELRVAPTHPVLLKVTAALPDGSLAAIDAAPYTVTARVAGVAVDGSAFVPVANGMEITLDPSVWLHNDKAVIRVSAPFLSGTNEIVVTLTDGVATVPVHFNLRMAVRANITAAPGEDRFELVNTLLANDSRYGSDPLYQDMMEQPHGGGMLRYADGAPAIGMPVDIEARWVPIQRLSGVRNMTESPDTTTAFPSWCRAGRATTDGAGYFAWRLDDPSFCLPNGNAELWPVGRWEVRARPQVPTAENRVSEIATFYVDPTGGLLLRASFGLA